MKKLLIVLLALTVLGIFAFAQDAAAPAPAVAKFSAWNYGQLFLYNKIGSNDATYGWGPTWDAFQPGVSPVNMQGGTGVDQEWGFSYDSVKDKNGNSYGFSATMEFGGPVLLNPYGWDWYETYFKFGDMAKFSLGDGRIDYGTSTNIEGADAERFINNGQYSLDAEFYPVPGLMVALAAFVPQSDTLANVYGVNASIGSLGAPGNAIAPWNAIATATGIDYSDNWGIAAKYTVSGIGSILAQYKRLGNSIVNADALVLVADYTAFQNVDLKVQFDAKNLDSNGFAGSGTVLTTLWVNGTWSMAPFTATGVIGFAHVTSTQNSFAFEVEPEYALGGGAVAGANIGYDDGEGIGLLGSLGSAAWDGFEVWPYVKQNFDNGSYIDIGILYSSGANGHDSVFGIPITYSWAF
jgi:hypothetical protein